MFKKLQILDQAVFEIDLVLEEDAKASLKGLITDKSTKKPLEGVYLKIVDNSTKKEDIFITSESGIYVHRIAVTNIKYTI